MLEQTNSELQKQIRTIKEEDLQLKENIKPYIELKQREEKVPFIVRSDNIKKGKFLGIW